MRYASLALLVSGCTALHAEPAPTQAPAGASAATAVLVASAEVEGTPEPCGCNSEPLGDVSRIATLARAGLWLDAGSLSYQPDSSPERALQADAVAAELGRIFANADVGLGAHDLERGPAHVTPSRLVANLATGKSGGLAGAASRLHTVGGVSVGVFGVVQPERVAPFKVRAGDPVAAARREVAALRARGARVVVALCGMSRGEARALLRAVPGIDFGIVGAEVDEGMPEPEPVGQGFLVAPAEQAKRVARLEVHVVDKQPLALWAGPAAQRLQIERIERRRATLAEQVAAWKKDPGADRAFVAAREHELTELGAERTRLAKGVAAPAGSYFSYELVPVRTKIARDPVVAQQLQALWHAVGQANLRAAASLPELPVPPGTPRYVGASACQKCHKAAVDFWQHTVHAQAWRTLAAVDKQYNYDCIGCHVTGWQAPGGVNLASAEKRGLVDVQCEVCHGPGSRHVADAGLDEPRTIRRRPADDFCANNCHTREHSDTFELSAYLRDVLGPGHGAAARARLGDGPTGHELRRRALERAAR